MTIAYWSVLAAVLLPYVCFGIARNRARGPDGKRSRDNRNPRDFPNFLSGLPKRAWGAHLNSFEALPGFAAAIIIAHLTHAPQHRIDTLAVTWIVARLAYIAFYLSDRASLRTASQVVSLLCVLGLFVIAAIT
jgi:uncharacterized MAPEG superfamily protein